MARSTWLRVGTTLSLLTLLSCQTGPNGSGWPTMGGPGRFALDFGGARPGTSPGAGAAGSAAPEPGGLPIGKHAQGATPGEGDLAVVTNAAPPAAEPVAERRGSGGGGSRRRSTPAPAATPTPGPTPPLLEPLSFAATFGNPADPLKIDGVRLDPDFATNGELHLAFSVFGQDGTDLSALVDPTKTRAVMSFADEAPTPAPTATPTAAPTATPTPAPTPTPTASSSSGPYRLLDLTAISVVVEAIPGNGRPPLDVVLAIDSTGSMLDTDPDRLRVGAAKGYIDQMRPADQLAVMDFALGLPPAGAIPNLTFDGIPNMRLLHDMSKDRDAAKLAIDQITASGGTNLYDALARSITYLTTQTGNRPRGLIALTDGQENASTMATLEDVAAAAQANDVLLMLLAFSGYDETAMHQVTTEAGGWFVGAEDPTTLETQFGAAVRTLNGNAQAIIFVPQDQRIARHMAGRLTVTIDGQDYSGTFNVKPPPVGP